MQRFSERVENILRAARWFPGRHVHVSLPIAEMVHEGFVYSEPAQRLLEEFYGLVVSSLDRRRVYLTFLGDGDDASLFYAMYLPLLLSITDEPVFPLGFINPGVLYAMPSGRVAWLQHEWDFIMFYTSIDECLELHCTDDIAWRKRTPRLIAQHEKPREMYE